MVNDAGFFVPSVSSARSCFLYTIQVYQTVELGDALARNQRKQFSPCGRGAHLLLRPCCGRYGAWYTQSPRF